MANIPTSTLPFAGQVFYVPTHNPSSNRPAPWYFVPGLSAPQQHSAQLAHLAQQAQLAHLSVQPPLPLMHQTMQLPTQAPAQIEQQPVLLQDHTNAKIMTIKEKAIGHYIEGQLILETSRPLSKKRKRSQSQIEKAVDDSSETTEVIDPKSYEDEVAGLRAEMPKWSVAEVVRFIERHDDIKQYAWKFADDEVDGKALLLMIDRNLNLQMLASMFKHGPAMKIEAALSKYKATD